PPQYKGEIAFIRVPIPAQAGPLPRARLEALGYVPEMTGAEFDQWCRPFGHAAIARMVNAELGTAYNNRDMFKLRAGYRAGPVRIRAMADRMRAYDPEDKPLQKVGKKPKEVR